MLNRLIIRSINLLSLCFIFCAFISCSKKDDEVGSQIPADAVYDFVTLVESDHTGSVFEFIKADDLPPVRYTSTYDLASSSTHVSVGDRVIICYRRVDGPTYTDGNIKLFAFAKLSNSDQKMQVAKTADYDNLASPPFMVEALWRSGEYINLIGQIYALRSINPEKFVLVADARTIDDEMPQMHMVYQNKEGNEGQNPIGVNASFDISEVWNKPSCRGITIHYTTADGQTSTSFYKK